MNARLRRADNWIIFGGGTVVIGYHEYQKGNKAGLLNQSIVNGRPPLSRLPEGMQGFSDCFFISLCFIRQDYSHQLYRFLTNPIECLSFQSSFKLPIIMSTTDETMRPFFTSSSNAAESPNVDALIKTLELQKHPEGGYFKETDRDPLRVAIPFITHKLAPSDSNSTQSASTTIYYLLTPASPTGQFHRNKGKTIHTLHKGRGRYIIIHADENQEGQKARLETFVVGHDIPNRERLQWLVEGGKYKASFLLPDTRVSSESEGLLISEVSITPKY